MTQSAGRRTCNRCGANNFDTVTACWKCGAPLASGAVSKPVQPAYAPERPIAPAYTAPAVAGYADGDTAMANRAAVFLALTLPFIGLPVGWIFMMIEERRKQAVGRLCATRSLIALVLHLVVTAALVAGAVPYLLQYMDSGRRGGSNSGASGGLDGLPGGLNR